MVTVKLLGYLILDPPGTVLRAWGFDFTVQTDGTAVCELPENAAAREEAAGRVAIVSRQATRATAGHTAPPLETTVDNYFGAGSLEALRETFRSMSRTAIEIFARKNLGMDPVAGMNKESYINIVLDNVSAKAASAKED